MNKTKQKAKQTMKLTGNCGVAPAYTKRYPGF